MANATVDLILERVGKAGLEVELPVASLTKLFKGTMVAVLTATGDACALTTALSGACVGVAQHGIDNSAGLSGAKRVRIETDMVSIQANDTANPVTEATLISCPLYALDDHTVSDTQLASEPIAGYFAGLEPDGRVRVYHPPLSATPVIASFANSLHTHANAAGGGQITPATAFAAAVPATLGGTGQTTTTAGDVLVGAAANTIAKLPIGTTGQVLSVAAGTPAWANTLDPALKGVIEIELGTITDADGDQAKFANGGADGMTIADSKAVCYRINNAAPPPKNLFGFGVPADANVGADFTMKFLCSKSGATIGDATTIVVELFNQVDGALHDADADYGGTTNALVGDAPAKTLDVLSLTLAHANLPVVGSKVSGTFTATNGTLGTDDLLIHRIWVEYTKAVAA